VAYCAFCGKAAEVLRKRGNPHAMTLHKLLYDSVPRPGGGFVHRPKTSLDFTIVVVDEISMLPKSMLDLLLRHKIYCIFLGDPFQLSQIFKNEEHDLLDHPHVFLDEVMRQAAESEIIQLTMKIRNKEDIHYSKGKEVMVIPKKELIDGCYLWADQTICATNQMRKYINNHSRDILGISGLPKDGEHMICLRNYWEDFSDTGNPLVNGSTGIIRKPQEGEVQIPRWVQCDNQTLLTIDCDFETEEGTFHNVRMDKHLIEKGEKCVDWRTSYKLGKLIHRIGDIVPREFDFAYAITAWKSQGNEWDKILAIEENFPFDKIEHARFLYTVCTRASKKLVLVRN
jgi:exodeoxyribonuclease-5